jgi:predicted PurR-regulated permease PerM
MNDGSPPAIEHRPDDRSTTETRVTDLARLGIIGLFAYWSLTLVAPFAVIVIWAAILAVALYPCYQALRVALGGSKRLAAVILTLLMLCIIIGPLAAIALNFVEAVHWLLTKMEAGSLSLAILPQNVRAWPLIGERAHAALTELSNNLAPTLEKLQPALLQAGGVILGKAAKIGLDLLGFVASVIIAGFFFGPGPQLAAGIDRVAERVAGTRGVGFVRLAQATIRNVATGVIGVALLQSLLIGLILYLFDIPAAGGLTFVILILCIIQLGPALVLLPVLIWAWLTKDFGYAIAMTLLLVPVAIIDNVMKPILVARGLKTPMLVIFMGVIGGTLSYGLIGLFLGPIVLSVFYDLLVAWARVPDAKDRDIRREPR